jgi:parvulin-like peptidyl-prolyl isomerase
MKRLCILLLAAFTGGILSAQSDLQPAAIVRLTKSEPITVKQWRAEVEKLAWPQLAQRLGRQPTSQELSGAVQRVSQEEKRQVLEMMINERLALQAAERDKISVSEGEVNQHLQQLRAGMEERIGRAPTEAEFALAVRNETGLDVPAFREQRRRQLIVQKYLFSKKQDKIDAVKPLSDAEILNIYTLEKKRFAWDETVRYSMITVPFSDAASKIKAKETADRLVREIGSNPAKFDEAVLKGRAPNAGYEAADERYLPQTAEAQNEVGAEFMETAFSLKQGEVSRLLEAGGGYRLIKITGTYHQKFLDLDDIYQPGDQITVRQYIGQSVYMRQYQQAMAAAQEELVTELRKGNPFQVMEANLNL